MNAMASSIYKRALILLLAFLSASGQTCTDDAASSCTNTGHYPTWEDAPASVQEFDHDNDKSICSLPIITVEEWETGRYWEKEEPVIVKNVTDGWLALQHWTK
jgi:hypothetical protein